MTDERKALEEAWDDFAQTDKQFRRWACSIADERGTTQAGRFTAMLDCGAYLSAAEMLVPEGWTYDARQGPSGQPHTWELKTIGEHDQRYRTVSGRSTTPALALLGAIREARKNDPHGTA